MDCLIPRFDYGKKDCYLVFYHQVKPRQTKEIKAEWFDFNYGEKVLWLLIRECKRDLKGQPQYRNIKLENIDSSVKMVFKENVKRVKLNGK
ncbi:hypothetical protein BME96_18890 (plasmid) [Virgibacillus halodenitrificans]|uniref:Uncharacterized protein n=1 Tax=Virgibacillus halodenitrificans TaxID=1482 RepID=A0AAC9J359_VIRHA|nr:hypothetical protein BME96_18890 [Virgibacillus halodenitrificans]